MMDDHKTDSPLTFHCGRMFIMEGKKIVNRNPRGLKLRSESLREGGGDEVEMDGWIEEKNHLK